LMATLSKQAQNIFLEICSCFDFVTVKSGIQSQ
jgi:hypothetical protein